VVGEIVVTMKHVVPILGLLMSIMMMTGFVAAAENSSPNRLPEESEIAQLWNLLEQTYSTLQRRLDKEGDAVIADKLLSSSCEGKTLDSWESKLLRAKADNMSNKNGLEFRVGYSTSSFDNQNKDPRSYLELSWDVLRSGYLDYSRRADILSRKAEIADLRSEQKQNKETYRCRRYQIAQQFSGLYASLLSTKLSLMEPVHNIERRAYFKGWSYLDDYLVAAEDISLLRSELTYLNSDPELDLVGTKIINPPVVDVDIRAVIKAIRSDRQHSKIVQLEKRVLKETEQAQEQKRFRLFLRQDVDVANNQRNENNLVAGFRIYIPLEKQNNDQFAYKADMLNDQSNNITWERIARTKEAYAELREQMQRVIKQYFRYQQSLERVRRIFVARRLGDEVEVAVAIMRMRTLLSSAVELVKTKQSLYRRINNVFFTAGLTYQSDQLKPVSMQALKNRVRAGSRSIYVWSKTFNKMPNPQIIDFMEVKGIERVLLSASDKTERNKLDDFIDMATQRGLKVELMVGANRWVFPENHQRAATTAGIIAEKTGAIHLDIEPHTLAEYRQNPDQLLNGYVSMLKKIRATIADRQLSVSVPMHWPKEIYRQVAALVDTVYIMTYGDKRIAKLEKRVSKAMGQIPAYKTVIVLRNADFVDEWALEQAFDRLQRNLGVQQFGIHSFRTFLEASGSSI